MLYPNVTYLDLPAEYHYLSIIGSCTRAVAHRAQTLHAPNEADEMFLYSAELGVHEMCKNIIEHAYGEETGRILVQFTLNAQSPQIQIDLYDDGAEFDKEQVTLPNLKEPLVKGHGLFLARQLLDEVSYEREGDRNHWRILVKPARKRL